MATLSTQLSATFSALQRLQREHRAVSASLLEAEDRLADLEKALAGELPGFASGSRLANQDNSLARELMRLKGKSASLRSSASGDGTEARDLDSQISHLERRLGHFEDNPLDDPTQIISPDLGRVLSQLEQAAQEVSALKSRREDLERRIAIFQSWVFEEVGEPLPMALVPTIAGVLLPNSPASEVFRLLRTKIQAIDDERPFRCFGLVSASASEGKTTTALSLALYMAREPGSRVLFVEADLRKPAVESYLGLPRRVGLAEWLSGSVGPVRLRRLEPSGLYLLTAGAPVNQAAELLGSGRMAQLMEIARQSFDSILVDCPPPMPFADSVILQELLDGFLFVVRARHSPRETIQASLPHLRQEAIRGVIFNDHRDILPRLYTQGYVRYGGPR